MDNWEPISEKDFLELFAAQYEELDDRERVAFERFRVQPWMATIRRSERTGDEHVFVVAQANRGVLYFDDVEYGFNISDVDDLGRILSPGGSQYTLSEAVSRWFPMEPPEQNPQGAESGTESRNPT
jgi:hypothetical protein